MKAKRFSESLMCQLTPEQVAERANRAARLQHDADELTSKLASETKRYKTSIQRSTMEQHRLLDEVRTRQGYRPVECERQPDYEAGLLRTVRLDTGEIVRQRQLTPEERQTLLFVDGDYPEEWEIEKLGRTTEAGVEELELPRQPEDGPEPKETR